jgi:hypothetical protein
MIRASSLIQVASSLRRVLAVSQEEETGEKFWNFLA